MPAIAQSLLQTNLSTTTNTLKIAPPKTDGLSDNFQSKLNQANQKKRSDDSPADDDVRTPSDKSAKPKKPDKTGKVGKSKAKPGDAVDDAEVAPADADMRAAGAKLPAQANPQPVDDADTPAVTKSTNKPVVAKVADKTLVPDAANPPALGLANAVAMPPDKIDASADSSSNDAKTVPGLTEAASATDAQTADDTAAVDSADEPTQTVAAKATASPIDAETQGSALDVAQVKAPIQPVAAKSASAAADTSQASVADDAANVIAGADASADADKPRAKTAPDAVANLLTAATQQQGQAKAAANVAAGTKADAAPQPSPAANFAQTNHAEIVKNIHTQLLPRGGTMQIRLDPPELGALQVTVSMKDGVMSASFQTSNDDATRLLSHSLTQLKSAMESAGVSVDKLQVQQSPKDTQAKSGDDSSQQRGQPGQDDMLREQEQQRKDMIRKMWRKLAGESDPLDMVA